MFLIGIFVMDIDLKMQFCFHVVIVKQRHYFVNQFKVEREKTTVWR